MSKQITEAEEQLERRMGNNNDFSLVGTLFIVKYTIKYVKRQTDDWLGLLSKNIFSLIHCRCIKFHDAMK